MRSKTAVCLAVLLTVSTAANVLATGASQRGGYGPDSGVHQKGGYDTGVHQKGCGCENCYSRCEHHGHEHWRHRRHDKEPPRAPVVSSVAAPLMATSPVVPFASMNNMRQSSLLSPELLRSLAAALEKSEPSSSPRQKAAPLQAPSTQKPAPSAAPPAPPRTTVGDDLTNLDSRLSQLESRMDNLVKLLEKLDKALDQ